MTRPTGKRRRESLQGHARDAEIAARNPDLLNVATQMVKRSEEQPITQADTEDLRAIQRLIAEGQRQGMAAHHTYTQVHADDQERVDHPARGSDQVQQRGDAARNSGA